VERRTSRHFCLRAYPLAVCVDRTDYRGMDGSQQQIPSSGPQSLEEKFRFVIGWSFVIIALLLAIAGLAWWLIADWNAPYLIKKLDEQFNVLIGIPASGAAALLLVIFLRTTDGPVEFEVPGFKFKGASGPIILWVLVFGSIVSAIKLLSK
jgi:hypothetical protein